MPGPKPRNLVAHLGGKRRPRLVVDGVRLGRRGGYCAFTPTTSRCETDDKGSQGGVATFAACEAYCRACARCRYISFNARTRDCSWYRTCDLHALLERDGGGEYVTAHVPQGAAGQEAALD